MVKELGLSDDIIVYEPKLTECSFGSWEGLSNAEIETRYPEEWTARLSDRWNVSPPSGESYADVYARMCEWFAEASLAETTLAICHGLTSRVLRGVYSGFSRQEVLQLDEPQNGFFQLRNGTEVFIE